MKKMLFWAVGSLVFCQQLTAQVNFQSSNLPIIKINTNGAAILDSVKIVATMQVIDNGFGVLNYVTDEPNNYNNLIGIELRGSTSQELSPKKPYSIETRKADGESNNDVSLLGLPVESDWVLLAPYSDKSLMRDALTYQLAASFMPYASRSRFCEVTLNGEYLGVYVLLEKVKRDKNRVNIDKLEPNETANDALTGGYILKIDKETGGVSDGFASEHRPKSNSYQTIYFQYHYPKPDVIVAEQKTYIRGVVRNFENVLKSEGYKDSLTGYRKYAEIGSFIDFMLVNELTKNVDGYRLSTYFYKNKDSQDGRLKMGPVWDFNIALANANYCEGEKVEGWAKDFNKTCPDDYWLLPFWWERFFADEKFVRQARLRWQDLRKNQLTNENVTNKIDSLKNLLSQAQVRNFEKWKILNQWQWPNAYVGGTYGNETEYLKNWLLARMAWLDGAFEELDKPKYDPKQYFEPTVSPNPVRTSDEILFKYYVNDYENIIITIFDTQGKFVTKIESSGHLNGKNQSAWQPQGAASGVYFYQIVVGAKAPKTGKIVVW